MKKIIIVCLLLVLVVVCAPWLGGNRAKTEMDKLVVQINAHPSYAASWQGYKRGWLRSQGVLRISFVGLEQLIDSEGDRFFPLDLTLNHGPILVTDSFKLGWFSGDASFSVAAQSVFSEVMKQVSSAPLLQTRFHMSVAGKLSFESVSQPVEITLDDEVIKASAFTGQGEITSFGDLTYKGSLPGMVLLGNGAEVTLQDFDVNLNAQLSASALENQFAPGSASFTIKHAVGSGSDLDSFTLKNLRARIVNSVDAESLANTDALLRFDELLLEENQIDDFNFELAFERISLQFIKKYQASLRVLESSETASFDVLGLISSDLIPAGPQIHIKDFSFKSEKGDLTFVGAATVPPQAEGSRINPFAIFQTLLINAEFDAQKALVLAMMEKTAEESVAQTALESDPSMTAEQIAQAVSEQAVMQLDMLQLQGMLVEKEGFITAKFEFKNGVATLNGQPVPLSL